MVFGTTSLLVPSGFKNDSLYYQIPDQDIGMDQSKVYTVPARPAIDEANAINEESETEKEHVILKPMRSSVAIDYNCLYLKRIFDRSLHRNRQISSFIRFYCNTDD